MDGGHGFDCPLLHRYARWVLGFPLSFPGLPGSGGPTGPRPGARPPRTRGLLVGSLSFKPSRGSVPPPPPPHDGLLLGLPSPCGQVRPSREAQCFPLLALALHPCPCAGPHRPSPAQDTGPEPHLCEYLSKGPLALGMRAHHFPRLKKPFPASPFPNKMLGGGAPSPPAIQTPRGVVQDPAPFVVDMVAQDSPDLPDETPRQAQAGRLLRASPGRCTCGLVAEWPPWAQAVCPVRGPGCGEAGAPSSAALTPCPSLPPQVFIRGRVSVSHLCRI